MSPDALNIILERFSRMEGNVETKIDRVEDKVDHLSELVMESKERISLTEAAVDNLRYKAAKTESRISGFARQRTEDLQKLAENMHKGRTYWLRWLIGTVVAICVSVLLLAIGKYFQ